MIDAGSSSRSEMRTTMPRLLSESASWCSGFDTFVWWPVARRSSVSSTARRCPVRELDGSIVTIFSSNAVRPTASRWRFIKYANEAARHAPYWNFVIAWWLP